MSMFKMNAGLADICWKRKMDSEMQLEFESDFVGWNNRRHNTSLVIGGKACPEEVIPFHIIPFDWNRGAAMNVAFNEETMLPIHSWP